MNESLTFDISSLTSQNTGSNEAYTIDGPVKLEGIKEKSNLSGRIEIMKIDHGYNVKGEKLIIKVEFLCAKCLKKITSEIQIKSCERQFLFDIPENHNKKSDPQETFFIDKKAVEFDISEMLRQEIILHFPIISVCSSSCKGLCPICGKNRNVQKCLCKEEIPEENKPLAELKKLLK